MSDEHPNADVVISGSWPEHVDKLLRRIAELEAERDAKSDRRYLCTNGHHVVSAFPVDTCTAVVPWPGGEPCGAQLQRYRGDLAPWHLRDDDGKVWRWVEWISGGESTPYRDARLVPVKDTDE